MSVEFARWIDEQVGVIARSGTRIDDLLEEPERAPRSALAPEAVFAAGVIAGAAGALELTPRELLEFFGPPFGSPPLAG